MSNEVRISGRTAIARNRGAASSPLEELVRRRLPRGVVLHHGCGKDRAGTALLKGLKAVREVLEYDPNHADHPGSLFLSYDTVVSNYVLNVLPPMDRGDALRGICECLKPSGIAYISVRGPGDRIRGRAEHDGVRTTSGTFQRVYSPEQLLDCLSPHFGICKIVSGSGKSRYVIAMAGKPRTAGAMHIGRRPGKSVGPCVYVHRDYTGHLPCSGQKAFEAALHLLPERFKEYAVVKYDSRTGSVSFLISRDWDASDEPEVGDSVMVDREGNVKVRKASGQIYHHKWLFVGDDYSGFSVEKSKERSRKWESSGLVGHSDRRRIGSRCFWETRVLPLLGKN